MASYSLRKNGCNNPFELEMSINDSIMLGILDTGADTTFIPVKAIGETKFYKTFTSAKAANGATIRVLGKIKNL